MNSRKEEIDHYWKLRDAFYGSEGIQLYNRILSSQLSYYTFEMNYIELHQFIELHYKLRSERKLGDFYNRKPLHDYLAELTRLLHNFLASAKSLVDHTRNFIRNSYGNRGELVAEYDKEVKLRLSNNPVCKFTQELRVFFTHISMPFVSSVIGASNATGRDLYTLKLNIDKMGKSERWSAKAREYIQNSGPDIDLETYVDEYYQVIHQFYEWLGDRNEIWGKEALEKALRIQDEILKYGKHEP